MTKDETFILFFAAAWAIIILLFIKSKRDWSDKFSYFETTQRTKSVSMQKGIFQVDGRQNDTASHPWFSVDTDGLYVEFRRFPADIIRPRPLLIPWERFNKLTFRLANFIEKRDTIASFVALATFKGPRGEHTITIPFSIAQEIHKKGYLEMK